MNDEQLEAAAHKLCEIRGWKPDSIDHLMAAGPANPLHSALDHCKREIIAFYQVAQAVDAVIGAGDLPAM